MIWFVPPLLTVALVVLLLLRLGRRPLVGELLQLIGQVPARPGAPGLQWMFIGRFDPPDADPRKAPAVFVDERPEPPLPPGLKRIDQFEQLPVSASSASSSSR